MADASPIDPNVKIPAAIRRQAEAAQAAFDQANNIQPAPAADPVPEVVSPPIAPEVTPAGNADVSWEHKYNSMKGRFDASQNNIRSMSDQIATMSARMAQLEARPAEPLSPDLNPASLLSAEEVGEYGAEFLTVVGKKALEQLSPEMTKMKRELDGLKAQLGGTAEAAKVKARHDMEVSLDGSLPTWREVNFMPEFHSWLKLQDPFSGAIRHELLTAAYERNDTPRVLAFFNGFLAQEAALAPALSDPAHTATADKIPLADFAAPGRAKTAAASGAPVEKPTFTTDQITAFYAASRQGKFRGKEAEYNRIEAQIFDAQREGRIR